VAPSGEIISGYSCTNCGAFFQAGKPEKCTRMILVCSRCGRVNKEIHNRNCGHARSDGKA
jgi:hypothetical protein